MKFKLNGLDCANCAKKIEDELNKMDIVDEAIVNFNTECLILKLKDNNDSNIQLVKEKILEIEDVKISDYNDHYLDDYSFDIIKIIVSLILFIIGLFINNDFYKMTILIISYIIVGYDIVIKAIKNLFKGSVFDENFLMTIATIGAFCINEASEAVAVMLFYSIGELLQTIAVNKSRKNISNLMDIKSDYANVVNGDSIEKTNINKVEVNDIIVVKPGEKIPLDGIVIEGNSFIDTSSLTGEGVPIKINPDDEVLSGSINKDSLLKIRVSKKYNDSTVSKILEMVENSTNKKSSSEKFITKFSKIYTPIVVLIAFLIAIIPPLISDISFYDSIYKALVCLVISCPCALVLSIPLSFFSGIGCASKHGILIKGSNYIDKLSNVDCCVFDKTGTLTKGVFEVVKINTYNGFKRNEVLKYCSYAEYYSNHPIGNSILNKYNKSINKDLISKYKEISGKGISVIINNKKILVGNSKLLEENNIDFLENNSFGTVVYLSVDGVFAGSIVISDVVKEESIDVISILNKMNINSIMLTGDNNIYAREMCNKIGIKKYYSDLLPDNKVEKLEEVMKEYNNVAFIGDGINDSPVLARSDVGIAMGSIGSDAAIEAADVVLINDNLFKIIDSINISKRIKKIVIQNIILILLIKMVFMILGIIGVAYIWQAVIGDVGVTIIAVINSMRCLKYKSIN